MGRKVEGGWWYTQSETLPAPPASFTKREMRGNKFHYHNGRYGRIYSWLNNGWMVQTTAKDETGEWYITHAGCCEG